MRIAVEPLGSKSLPEPSSVVVVGLAVVVGFLVVVLVVVVEVMVVVVVVTEVVVEVAGLVVLVLGVVVVVFGAEVGLESWLPWAAGGWVSQVQSDPPSPCLHKSSQISENMNKLLCNTFNAMRSNCSPDSSFAGGCVSQVQSDPASPVSHSSTHSSLWASSRNSLQAGEAIILRFVWQSVGRSRPPGPTGSARPSGPLGRAKLRTMEGRRNRRAAVFILACVCHVQTRRSN